MTRKRPSAKDILDGIVQALHDAEEPLDEALSLVPAVYDVMLHPRAYQEMQVLLPRIKAQAKTRLDDELAHLNRRRGKGLAALLARLLGPLMRLVSAEHYLHRSSGAPRTYERVGERWQIEFVVTAEPGAEVDYLSVATDYGAVKHPGIKGRPTVNIRRQTTRMPDGRFETVLSMPRAGNGSETYRTLPPVATRTGVLARLSYEDNRGRHVFYMRKPEITLGRADDSSPALDVALHTVADVSREHARIRYAEDEDAFYVMSTGRFGTTVDGEDVPAGPSDEGRGWHALGTMAEIGLANAVFIHFEAV